MRGRRYDVAMDLQGLIKSAAMARLSGAKRVIGFEAARCANAARPGFTPRRRRLPHGAHIIQKNLSVLPVLGVADIALCNFRSRARHRPSLTPWWPMPRRADRARFVLFNPGAAWPNKRWPPERFGALAQRIVRATALPVYVLWGRAKRRWRTRSSRSRWARPCARPDKPGRPAGVVVARGADGVWRHRSDSSRRRDGCADRGLLRSDVARAQRSVASGR